MHMCRGIAAGTRARFTGTGLDVTLDGRQRTAGIRVGPRAWNLALDHLRGFFADVRVRHRVRARTSRNATDSPSRGLRLLGSSHAADCSPIRSVSGAATASDRHRAAGEGLTAANEAIRWIHAGRDGVRAESSRYLPTSDSRLSAYFRNAKGFAVDHDRT